MSYSKLRAVIVASCFCLHPYHSTQAQSVQMLPPTTNAASPSPCEFGTNQVLTLNDGTSAGGHSAINCNNNFVATPTGQVGIGTASPNSSLDLSNKNDAVSLPSGTTAQEPASAAEGMLRYNSDSTTKGLEFYNGTRWMRIPSCAPGSALVYDTTGQLGCSAAAPIVTQVISCPVGYYPPPDNSWGCQADCPANTTVISGGSQASAFSVAPGSGVYSMPNGNGWLCDVGALTACTNGAGAPCGATCYAVCATLH